MAVCSFSRKTNGKNWQVGRSRGTLPAGDVLRAQLILALADGWSYREIEQKLNTSAPAIASDDPEFDSKAADIIGRT